MPQPTCPYCFSTDTTMEISSEEWGVSEQGYVCQDCGGFFTAPVENDDDNEAVEV